MQNYSDVDLWHFDCTSNDTAKCKAAYWMWRTIPFILFVIGIGGNIMNIVILSRPNIRKFSTSVYLLFLAGSDMVFLFTAALNDTIYSIKREQFADISKPYCYIYRWLRYNSGAFSVWLLALVTIDRSVLIRAPVFARTYLSPKLSVIISVGLLVIITLSNTHLIYGSSYEVFYETFGQYSTCDFTSESYKQFYVGAWPVMVLVFYTVLPSTIIFIGNANIAIVLLLKRKRFARIQPSTTGVHTSGTGMTGRHPNNIRMQTITTITSLRPTTNSSQRRFRNDINGQSTSVSNEPRSVDKRKSLTGLLFTISIYFLLTTLPFCIYTILRDRLTQMSQDDIDRWRLLTIFMYVLLWSNFSCNFFLYFASGTLFRQELKKIVRAVKSKLSQLF